MALRWCNSRVVARAGGSVCRAVCSCTIPARAVSPRCVAGRQVGNGTLRGRGRNVHNRGADAEWLGAAVGHLALPRAGACARARSPAVQGVTCAHACRDHRRMKAPP
eukprot:7376366-Prymnesium_polylepis.1